MKAETFIGIDLSGPGSEQETAVISATAAGDYLRFLAEHPGTDFAIHDLVQEQCRHSLVIVGIDAPLSYQPGGGQRARDADLRRRITAVGLHPGSVMAPTFQRMAWLTLRGIGLAHILRMQGCAVVEVHPGGCLALRGAPIADVRGFRDGTDCRLRLLKWLASAGFLDLNLPETCSSHLVAACAATLAAHGWRRSSTAWLARAEPPWHPYDFAC